MRKMRAVLGLLTWLAAVGCSSSDDMVDACDENLSSIELSPPLTASGLYEFELRLEGSSEPSGTCSVKYDASTKRTQDTTCTNLLRADFAQGARLGPDEVEVLSIDGLWFRRLVESAHVVVRKDGVELANREISLQAEQGCGGGALRRGTLSLP